MTISHRLKAIRTRQRITQSTLAELSGVREATIANLERGAIAEDYVRVHTLCKLARGLKVSVAELLEDQEEPTESSQEVCGTAEVTSVGTIIRAAREAKNWTVYRVTRETGISQTYLLAIESDAKRPGLHIVGKIARVLSISLAEFDQCFGLPQKQSSG